MNFQNLYIFLLVLTIGSLHHHASGQKYYDTFNKIEQENGIVNLQNALDLELNKLGRKEEFPVMAHDFSVQFYKRREYETAIYYALKEIEYFEKKSIVNPTYRKALFQTAHFYELTAQFQIAISYYNKVIESDKQSIKAIQSYGKIGNCYFKLGNYFQAETFYLKSIELLENFNQFNLLSLQYLNLSRVYHTINTKMSRTKELEALNKVLEIKENHLLSKRTLSMLYNNLANYYNTEITYDFKKASFYYKELLKYATINKDSTAIGIAYGNLGNLYIKKQNDSAYSFLKKSFKYPLPSTTQSRIHRNLTDYYIQQDNITLALAHLDSSLLINTNNDKSGNTVLSLQNLKDSKDLIEVISGLSKKGEILLNLYEKNKKKQQLLAAFENLQTADSLVDFIQYTNQEQNSKLYWRKEASKVYHKAVYCSFLLENNDLAFTYSEKNKAILLTENIIENSEDIPAHIRKRKNFLKNKLIEYEQEQSKVKDSALFKFYKNKIVNQKIKLKSYNDSLTTLYPTLYNKEHKLVTLKEVQNQLPEDQIIISYLWNKDINLKDHLLSILITNQQVHLLEIEEANELKLLLNQYLKGLLNSFKTKENKMAFEIGSHEIFNRLFPNSKIKNLLKGKKITIIADGFLQKIPFESLITDLQKSTFLIEQNQINYVYSLSFLKNNNSRPRNSKKQLLAFSPTHFEHLGLSSLYNTNDEVLSINNYIAGDKYLNQEATKETFKENFEDYAIIHLATHASAGKNPYIAFYDDKLNNRELYGMENNAQLVFLSACDTSIGEIIDGEGTLSIARGFFHSGSKSVIASLWKTSDKSTSLIVEDFYRNLKDGNGPSTSLHLAKLKYIREHQLSDVSPYYWSSLIILGDDAPIELDKTTWFIKIIAMLCLLLLVVFIAYKKFIRKI